MLRKKFSPNLIALGAIFLWFIYAIAYIALKNDSNAPVFAGYLSLIGETGLDILDGESGIEIAKELHRRKFFNLYITTGHNTNQFNDIEFIKGVVGKEPPFLECFVQGCTK
ncbi:MAG TPA: hypothetical protein VJN02_09980 [Gammaproteobacteria bacterium]|nr:hypothetical protein [Gammaproteobacteria bacterium]